MRRRTHCGRENSRKRQVLQPTNPAAAKCTYRRRHDCCHSEERTSGVAVRGPHGAASMARKASCQGKKERSGDRGSGVRSQRSGGEAVGGRSSAQVGSSNSRDVRELQVLQSTLVLASDWIRQIVSMLPDARLLAFLSCVLLRATVARDAPHSRQSGASDLTLPAAQSSRTEYILPEHRLDPFFDPSTARNVTVAAGKTAYLSCRVRHLGERTVSSSPCY